MDQGLASPGEQLCRIVDGRFTFHCSFCRKQWQLSAPLDKRVLRVRCKCLSKSLVKLNRRQHPRKPARNPDARILMSEKKSSYTKIVDSSPGGYCIEAKRYIAKNLSVGDPLKLEYKLHNTQCVDDFVIRSVRGNFIGLQYEDGQYLTPNQRVNIRFSREANA